MGILSNIYPQRTKYTTRYGLPQSVVDYLNQALPDISNLYTSPVEEDFITRINPIRPGPDDPEGIVSLYPQISGDGGGFNPYDVRPGDPGIRTPDQYNPYAYRQAAESKYVGDLYPTETGLQKQMSMYPDYYGVQGRTLTGIEQLMSKIPTPLGFVKKGLDAIADKLGPNRTGIFQNELLGGGFKLDNIGRIVTDNYNTPEGIMAGYNPVSGGLLNMLTGGEYGEPTTYGLDKSYDKRRETVAKALEKMGMSKEDIEAAIAGEYEGDAPINPITGKPTDLINRLGLFNQSQNLFNKRKEMADLIFEQQREEKRKSDPAFIEQQKIEKAAETRRDFQQAVAEAEKQRSFEQAAAAKRNIQQYTGGGGGGGKSAPSSGTGRGATSATSSGLGNLGFSDKRLKENIELIGKSPSNINIYKFNYKNNPTTYQGVMADEVSWASVKHPNGYMMVDYNKIDVEFKKI
jgi:hypothetical protein